MKIYLWLAFVSVFAGCLIAQFGADTQQLIEQYGTKPVGSYHQRRITTQTPRVVGEKLATVTAYSKTETCPDRRCITASGTFATPGTTVACPRSIKLRTKVEIDGHVYTCLDRTAVKFDGRFDIFMNSYQDAVDFGKQQLTVKIYD